MASISKLEREQGNRAIDYVNYTFYDNDSVIVADPESRKWTIKDLDETITVMYSDNFVEISVKGQGGFCCRKVYTDDLRNAIRLWFLEQRLKDHSKSRKIYKVLQNIGVINNIFVILGQPDTNIVVSHETNVMKRYDITYKLKNSGRTKVSVTFNGTQISFDYGTNKQQIDADENRYIAWRLSVLRKDLDDKIKQQAKAEKHAENKLYSLDLRTRIRCAMADLVLGRGNKR